MNLFQQASLRIPCHVASIIPFIKYVSYCGSTYAPSQQEHDCIHSSRCPETQLYTNANTDDGLAPTRHTRPWRIKGCFTHHWEISITPLLCLHSFRFVGDLANEFVLKNAGGTSLQTNLAWRIVARKKLSSRLIWTSINLKPISSISR